MFAVVAYDQKRGMAKDGKIPWDLPLDAWWARQMTENAVVIMGERTWAKYTKAIYGSDVIVLSRSKDSDDKGAQVAHSVDEAVALAEKSRKPISIMGGASVFAQFIGEIETIFATEVDGKFDCDIFFPEIDELKWKKTEILVWPADEQHDYSFKILRYDRNTDTKDRAQ